MTFDESVKQGLRIEGSESSVEGVRHRRRYRWSSREVKRLLPGGEAKVVDHGCGAGYGCMFIGDPFGVTWISAPGKGPVRVYGYDPDAAAVAHAREKHWPACTTDPSICERDGTRSHVIVTMGVLEHIRSMTPREHISYFFDGYGADAVVGFFPYRERPGLNPHHVWFGLTPEASLPTETESGRKITRRVWYEPYDMAVDEFTPTYPEAPRAGFFETGDPNDYINMLFVLAREA
jgi:hypothetical protein